MTKIKNFNEQTKTTQWLICTTIGDRDVWPADGGTPDFQITVGDQKIDPTKFFAKFGNVIDDAINRGVDSGVVDKLDDMLFDFADEIHTIREDLKKRVEEMLQAKSKRITRLEKDMQDIINLVGNENMSEGKRINYALDKCRLALYFEDDDNEQEPQSR